MQFFSSSSAFILARIIGETVRMYFVYDRTAVLSKFTPIQNIKSCLEMFFFTWLYVADPHPLTIGQIFRQTLKTHLSNNFSLAILANTMLSGLRGIFSFISLGNRWESDCVYVCAWWHNLNVTSRKEEHLNAALYSGDKFVCMCSHLLTLLCSCSFSVREHICVFSPAVFTSSVYFISKYSPFTFYIICLYLVFDVLFLSHS